MRVFALHSLLFPTKWGRTEALSSEQKIDQADFTGWISHHEVIMEQFSRYPEVLSANI